MEFFEGGAFLAIAGSCWRLPYSSNYFEKRRHTIPGVSLGQRDKRFAMRSEWRRMVPSKAADAAIANEIASG